MRSMTGYGRGRVSVGSTEAVVEVASVNKKNLDVAVYLPREWQKLEIDLAARVRERASRGRVTVNVTIQPADTGGGNAFDEAAVSESLTQLERLADRLGVPFEPTTDLLFRVASSSLSRVPLADSDAALGPIGQALDTALECLLTMRGTEGDALRQDLSARGEVLRGHLSQVRKHVPEAVDNYREGLRKRLRQIGLEIDLDDERILKEIALFADRADVSEELTRLDSHLEQWAQLIESDKPVGRQLEFLLQEVGREINTVGSKASNSAISRCVIDAKNELEKLREQVQNVE